MAQPTKPLTLEERTKNFDKHAAQICGPDALLVLKEKHSDIYFAIPNLETLYAVALAVVTLRFNDGWYSEGVVTQPPDKYEATLEEINAIPSEKIKASMLKEYEQHKRALEQWKYDKAEQDALENAIKTKNGRYAWSVLRDHNDFEYEGWDTIRLTTAKEYERGGL